MTDTALQSATDTLNSSRALEIEERNILSVNDQINEHEAEIQANIGKITAMQDAIRSLRGDTSRRRREQQLLRQRRRIFSRAAFDLKQVEQP